MINQKILRTLSLTSLALVAFAANSILCRYALGENSIDPGSFTFIRLLSGAIILLLLSRLSSRKTTAPKQRNIIAGAMLFIYAVCFSYAYVSLDTGTGALILFAVVQLTMISKAIYAGNKLQTFEWFGVALAMAGFIYLLAPSITTPNLYGFVLMSVAGIAWGFYTLAGKNSSNPLIDSSNNFFIGLLCCVLLVYELYTGSQFKPLGIALAIASGALASGLGYVIWYAALDGLSATQAAVAQLMVPIIAAYGGLVFSAEVLSLRLILALVMVLGGIALVIAGKHYHTVNQQKSNRD